MSSSSILASAKFSAKLESWNSAIEFAGSSGISPIHLHRFVDMSKSCLCLQRCLAWMAASSQWRIYVLWSASRNLVSQPRSIGKSKDADRKGGDVRYRAIILLTRHCQDGNAVLVRSILLSSTLKPRVTRIPSRLSTSRRSSAMDQDVRRTYSTVLARNAAVDSDNVCTAPIEQPMSDYTNARIQGQRAR